MAYMVLGLPVWAISENLASEMFMLISSSGPLLSASLLDGRTEISERSDVQAFTYKKVGHARSSVRARDPLANP